LKNNNIALSIKPIKTPGVIAGGLVAMGSLSNFLTNKHDINMSKDIENQQDTKNPLQYKLPIDGVVR